MFADIAIPKNNESEFIDVASKLGIKKLYFLYDIGDYDEERVQKKLSEIYRKGVDVSFGLIINNKINNKALAKSKLLVAKSSDNDRYFIEGNKVKVIYGFEETPKRDYLHQRASGLNQVLCGLLKKNNIAVGFSYSSMLNQNAQVASLIMGRMMQNINLCQKYKVATIIGSFSNEPYKLRYKYDIKSLFSLLGMGSNTIKSSLTLDILENF